MSETGRRKHRRVQVGAVPGTDPEPQSGQAGGPQRASEDTDRAWNDRGDSNDERLRQDVPPHW
ncbi:hypothetical protein [Leifsonia sp. PS1209]|uniref:hypothetical protein n=1 Tax=Leifsonia sp. PS1209 TaxID=2724914 RepID=UPI001442BDB9|nr:hypothetical protein [Leifsonia sp. PS1209]QIZ97078.1 hypothetical protein HF024_13275 [Leifsonia sp. PS1209]